VPPLVNSVGTVASNPIEKANLFASLFACNSTLDDQGKQPPLFAHPLSLMSAVKFTSRKTRSFLLKLDTSKSSGPDGIPAVVLKRCAPELAPVLSKLFRLSYNCGTCPSSWKLADVLPIPKKGRHSDPTNYRPISITSLLCKVMESLVSEQLLDFLETSKLFSDRQYGFRKARSAGDMLAYVTHLWSGILDGHGEAPIVSLDISKAFDRVWHRCLFVKLRHFGIDPSLISWIESFLCNRSIAVRLDGFISERHFVNSGVPQGSVLAPTLFLIFINDLLSLTGNPIHTYADDSTLHSCLKRSTVVYRGQASAELNLDLTAIVDWGKNNLVEFNSRKTHLVLMSRRTDVSDFPAIV